MDRARMIALMRDLRDLRTDLSASDESEDGMQRLAMGVRYQLDGHPEADEAQELLDIIWPQDKP